MSGVLVVGSLAYDTIHTPKGDAERTLGGSANYFSLAASLLTKVRVVGVVGADYELNDRALLEKREVDLSGLEVVEGKTFHWEGRYSGDMNEAHTLRTDLNVFENFNPVIPKHFTNTNYVFLANIDPELQLRVLDQVDNPRVVGSDTMNFWIDSKLDSLKEVLRRVNVLLLNEGEAKQLAGKENAIAAAETLFEMGPQAVVIKRGEYGFVLYTKEGFFILPAYPVPEVVDPTGAGDTFAGGFFGYLSHEEKDLSLSNLKKACMHGCLMASFTVQGFGVSALRDLSYEEFQNRWEAYMHVITS